MKPTLFETRQRAIELIREASEIWRKTESEDQLEGLENDPIFSMLMTALAYQENQTDSDIEFLKQQVLDDFAKLMTPFEVGHAMPATALIQTLPSDNLSETDINDSCVFKLESQFNFMPLFRSKVLNVNLSDVRRIDGRRWNVSLNFKQPVNDISKFCFAIKNNNFKNLNIYLRGEKLKIIRPWNYSELPFTECFNLKSMAYNHGEFFNASMLPMDLFARQDFRLFWIEENSMTKFESERLSIDLIFEFTGIKDQFVFDISQIIPNAVMLVNATLNEAHISSEEPIVRISGYSANDPSNNFASQFLHLVKPDASQLFSKTQLEVRKVAADRFNQGALLKLLNTIINKYYSDFYAFQYIDELKSEQLIHNLRQILAKLINLSQKDTSRSVEGVYLLLHNRKFKKDAGISLTVNYLTTEGASINNVLKRRSPFLVPPGLNATLTRQISNPVPGTNEIEPEDISKSLLKYYLATGDRIVTPADIKLFCFAELNRNYSITDDLVNSIDVETRQSNDIYGPGYEISVDISLKSNKIMQRSLAGRISSVEILLQKMIELRSTFIYPVKVAITIED